MTIAAHLLPTRNEPSYLLPCCLLLAARNPQDKFIFFIDPQVAELPDLPKNCVVINVSPALKNGLVVHYWYNFTLPSLLKKHNVSVFISESNVCSIRAQLPQCLLIKDLNWLEKKKYPNAYAAYNRRFFSKFVKVVETVLVTEETLAEALLHKYPVLKGKISPVKYGIPETYQLVSSAAHDAALEKMAAGHEYFLCECSGSTQVNLVSLLKSFSLFKKRLKSAMKMVILLRGIDPDTAVPDFKNYKFRNDIIFVSVDGRMNLPEIITNAYAFIYLDADKTAENAGLFAMKAKVPVITQGTQEIKAIYQESALYFSMDEQSIADKMMLLYKDELFRNSLLQKATLLVSAYDWELTAGKLWQTILDISRD